MYKQFFSLFVATGMFGAVVLAACSSSQDTSSSGGPAAADAATDSKPPKTDAKPPEVDSGPGVCPQDAKGSHDQIVMSVTAAPPKGPGPHKATPKSTGVCTDAVVTAFDTFSAQAIMNKTATFLALKDNLTAASADCAACYFKDANDATWGPIVTWQATNGDGGMFLAGYQNQAAVYEAYGMSEKCAGTYNNLFACARAACAVSASNCAANAASQCTTDALSSMGTCRTEFAADLAANCTAADNTALMNFSTASNKTKSTYTGLGQSLRMVCGTPIL
jgi:hypothetical protein